MIWSLLNFLLIFTEFSDALIISPAENSPQRHILIENTARLAFEFEADNKYRTLLELKKSFLYNQKWIQEVFTIALQGTKVVVGVCSEAIKNAGLTCGMFDRHFQLKNMKGLVTATISFDPDDISLNITIGQISQVVATHSKLTKTNKSSHEDTAIIYSHDIFNIRYQIKGVWLIQIDMNNTLLHKANIDILEVLKDLKIKIIKNKIETQELKINNLLLLKTIKKIMKETQELKEQASLNGSDIHSIKVIVILILIILLVFFLIYILTMFINFQSVRRQIWNRGRRIFRRNLMNKNDETQEPLLATKGAEEPRNNNPPKVSISNIIISHINKDSNQTYTIKNSRTSSQIKDEIIIKNPNLYSDDILLWIDGKLATSESKIFVDNKIKYCIAQKYPNNKYKEHLLNSRTPANIYNYKELTIKEFTNCLKNNDNEIIKMAIKESRILELLNGCSRIPNYEGLKRYKFDSLLILQKHLGGGSLSDVIYKDNKLKEDVKRIEKYCLDILTGLTEIHKRNIIHLDINPRNLIIDKNSQQIYIIDFTRSIILKDDCRCDKIISTKLTYAAPEVQDESPCYDTKADIWAFGCTLVKIMTKQPPYPNMDENQRNKKIKTTKKIEYPKENMDPFFIDVIDKCTSSLPADRPTAEQLLNMFRRDERIVI